MVSKRGFMSNKDIIKWTRYLKTAEAEKNNQIYKARDPDISKKDLAIIIKRVRKLNRDISNFRKLLGYE